jgi:hypothetical protein
LGRAIELKMPTIPTVIITSDKVKPLCQCAEFDIGFLGQLDTFFIGLLAIL